ncbi:MAG: hypothetical protein M3N29_10590 [Chloroflexota bacterium]|nr:hypothetical protein [Chloroflexota bacterium]
MAEHFDMSFESLVRSTLKAEAASLRVAIGPKDVLQRRDVRRRQRSRGRLRLLLIAALLVLPLSAALVAGVLRPDPLPHGYSAVLVRDVSDSGIQVLVANHGVAVRIADVPASRFGAIELGRVLEASASGWIALSAADPPEIAPIHENYVVLLDVTSPDAAPIIREGTHLGTWTPDGLYWSATNTAYELIDPVSRNIINLSRSVSADLDWWVSGNGRMSVATDGFGLLVGDPSNAVHDEEGLPYPQKWGVLGPEGTLSRGLPDLAEGVGPRRISARWGLLQRCGTGTMGDKCAGLRTGAIVSGPASDGSYRQWGADPPTHDHVIEGSWAVDGGLWLLVDRRSGGRTIVLTHRDENNVDREVASFTVDLDEDVTIGDLAADDSLIALELSGKFPALQTVIVDTRSGTSHLFDGALGGFVPAAATVGWGAGARATEEAQLLARPATGGPSPAYPPLRSLQEHIDYIEREAERILLVHEVEATSPEPGPIIQVTLGPVELDEGIGISLACSGPGQITLTELGPDGPDLPSTYTCLSQHESHGHSAPNVRWESGSVQVEYDPSTTWRLIIFDPSPHTPRP